MITPEEIDFDQWEEETYDVQGMKMDHSNNNFNPEEAERYRHCNMIQESIANGQFTQAKEFCSRYGYNYEMELFRFEQSQR